MKPATMILLMLPQLAFAGGGATGSNQDLLLGFFMFVLATLFSFGIARLKKYVVKRFKIVRK